MINKHFTFAYPTKLLHVPSGSLRKYYPLRTYITKPSQDAAHNTTVLLQQKEIRTSEKVSYVFSLIQKREIATYRIWSFVPHKDGVEESYILWPGHTHSHIHTHLPVVERQNVYPIGWRSSPPPQVGRRSSLQVSRYMNNPGLFHFSRPITQAPTESEWIFW